MFFLLFFFIFLIGLIAGSFANAIIYRLDTKESIILGRSHCPQCSHTLSWKDLIPVFSFLVLRGKCRYCQKPISWQYPLVELAMGILFLSIFLWQFNLSVDSNAQSIQFSIFLSQGVIPWKVAFQLFYYLLTVFFLVIIFVYDLKHYLIPDEIVYLAIVIAFLFQLFRTLNFEFVLKFVRQPADWNLAFKTLVNPLLSAFFASAFFLLIVLISREKWMGMGDVKVAALMGLSLGWPNIVVALFSAFFFGAIIGVGLIVLKKKNLKSEVPFAPFLITGTFIAIFWGEKVINWYLNFFL